MAKGKNIAYVRISPADQNEAGQCEALQSYEIDKWFIEKASGKDVNRPQLQKLFDYICKDDTIYVVEFSRLGRSTSDLLSIVQKIEETGATFISLNEKFNTKTPAGKLQLIMMAAIAEFEHTIILERQREGIAIAKKQGKYKGRKQISIPNIGDYYEQYMTKKSHKTEIAKELHISRNTLDRLFKEYKSSRTE
jgi:DNA invertase Pin-like site-specific DNA recombinase